MRCCLGQASHTEHCAQGVGLLLAAYIGAAVCAFQFPSLFRTPVMAGGHLLLASALSVQAFALERAKYTPSAIQAFYRFIWTLFYSEYFLFLIL